MERLLTGLLTIQLRYLTLYIAIARLDVLKVVVEID